MKRILRGLAVAMLCVIGALPATALAVTNPAFGYSLDLPIGWVEADNSDPQHVGFLSPNADAMLQVLALDSATAPDGPELAAFMLDQVRGSGEPEAFEYQGRSSALSDIAFVTGGLEVKGYMITVDDAAADYVLLAFAATDAYEIAHDHLLSALDSFAVGEESRSYPGPVSQFFYPFPPTNETAHQLPFQGGTLPFEVDAGEEEASQVLVDREARILEPYGALDRESFSDAWRRYFRMIYRDNYMRLAALAEEIEGRLKADGIPRVDIPRELLSWLQRFDYERTGGLSDFQPPVTCLTTASGDCDSLGMTYIMLLHHLGFDAILMVSDRYAHALAAVDVQGPGARFPFEGRQWLVAELTEDVPLGRIAANMADPAGWIGVRMRLRAVEGAGSD
jgi:hypothetical protein